MAKQIPVLWSWQRSRFKNSSGLKVFINLHTWNHCPGPALSPKWLENYMEPHVSSEILTRSDLTVWLTVSIKRGYTGTRVCGYSGLGGYFVRILHEFEF